MMERLCYFGNKYKCGWMYEKLMESIVCLKRLKYVKMDFRNWNVSHTYNIRILEKLIIYFTDWNLFNKKNDRSHTLRFKFYIEHAIFSIFEDEN